jgi:lysophospholipase L1-like esterase
MKEQNTSKKKEIDKGLLLFGDSIFFGIGASTRHNGCGYLLKQLLEMPVEIRSCPGTATDYAVENLEKRVLKNPKEHVLILFGNNDCRISDDGKPYIEKEKFADNLSLIVDSMKKNKLKPILCNLQPIDNNLYYKQYPIIKKYKKMTGLPIEWQNGYSELTKKIAKDMNIHYIDIRSVLEKNFDKIVSKDGLHPNDFGHELIAKTIAKKIKTIIK